MKLSEYTKMLRELADIIEAKETVVPELSADEVAKLLISIKENPGKVVFVKDEYFDMPTINSAINSTINLSAESVTKAPETPPVFVMPSEKEFEEQYYYQVNSHHLYKWLESQTKAVTLKHPERAAYMSSRAFGKNAEMIQGFKDAGITAVEVIARRELQPLSEIEMKHFVWDAGFHGEDWTELSANMYLAFKLIRAIEARLLAGKGE